MGGMGLGGGVGGGEVGGGASGIGDGAAQTLAGGDVGMAGRRESAEWGPNVNFSHVGNWDVPSAPMAPLNVSGGLGEMGEMGEMGGVGTHNDGFLSMDGGSTDPSRMAFGGHNDTLFGGGNGV